MPITNLSITHINTQRIGVAFTVTGSFQFTYPGWSVALEYSDDTANATAANANITLGTNVFKFVHPGYTTAGTHTLTVATPNGVSAKSNPFNVVKA